MTPEESKDCDHTLHAKKRDDSLDGSWTEELTFDTEFGQRLRVNCGVCGRFYGYVDPTATTTATNEVQTNMFSGVSENNKNNRLGIVIRKEEPPPAREQDNRPWIDFQELRRRISIRQVLELLEWNPVQGDWDRANGQLRGPCPIHHGQNPRSFSVNLDRNLFRCFKPCCDEKGNQLDLYAIATSQPLRQAAAELCQRLRIETPYK